MTWDAGQYHKFSQERSRPFVDLLAQVRSEDVRSIADLGCGTGNLTKTLLDRWPAARVVGVDNSPEMLAKSETLAIPGKVEFVRSDIATWLSDGPLDLIISNAALHWVADHEGLLTRLTAMLSGRGTLAVQMPDRFETPSQLAIEEMVARPRWSSLEGVGLSRDSVMPVEWYVRRLIKLGFNVNAWQTTYIHVLSGADPVLEWLKGTGLRPLLVRLGEQAEEFLGELAPLLRKAYPQEDGVTLFPFPRLFFVATRRETR